MRINELVNISISQNQECLSLLRCYLGIDLNWNREGVGVVFAIFLRESWIRMLTEPNFSIEPRQMPERAESEYNTKGLHQHLIQAYSEKFWGLLLSCFCPLDFWFLSYISQIWLQDRCSCLSRFGLFTNFLHPVSFCMYVYQAE